MFLICLSLCGVWCFGQLDVLLQAWDVKWMLCFSYFWFLSVAPRCPVTISLGTPKWLVSIFRWGRCERQYSSVTNYIGYRNTRGLPTSVLQNPRRKQGLQKDNWSLHPPPRSVGKNSAAFLFNGGRGERRRKKKSILKFHQFSQKSFQKFTSSLQIMHALEVLLIMCLQMSHRTYFHHSIRHQKSMPIWLYLTIQFNFLQ